MSKSTPFLARKWAWAREKPWAWCSVVLLGITALLLLVPAPLVDGEPSDARLRLWALSLQLLGSVIAWMDLTRTATDFQMQGVLKSHLGWLRRGWRPESGTSTTLDVHSARHDATASGVVLEASALHLNIEARIAVLERRMKLVHDKVDSERDRVNAIRDDLSRRIEAERVARVDALKGAEEKLRSLAVGGHEMLVFGALYVAAGTVTAALSPELALASHGRWADICARFL